jgi:hypothetical protein
MYVISATHSRLGPIRREVTVDEIGCLACAIPHRRDRALTTAHANQASVPHQPGNTFATDANAGFRKINLQTRCSVRAVRSNVRRMDSGGQLGITCVNTIGTVGRCSRRTAMTGVPLDRIRSGAMTMVYSRSLVRLSPPPQFIGLCPNCKSSKEHEQNYVQVHDTLSISPARAFRDAARPNHFLMRTWSLAFLARK